MQDDSPAVLLVDIGNVPFHALTTLQAREIVAESIRGRRRPPLHITASNVDYLAIARRDPDFLKALRDSGLRLADGMPLIWLSKLLRQPLPERVTGSDMTRWLIDGAVPGARVYLLGSTPEVLKVVAARAEANGTKIVGTESPWGDELESPGLVDRINEAEPDVLLVAFDSPRQQVWLDRRLDRLRASVVVGAGASLDFIAGAQRRAPARMQRLGFEWLFRLVSDPRRLWRRYIARDVPFLVGETIRVLRRRLGAE
jgi:N-acetylglucosaminyldiphosphoundecaprenol N-acetyl-beta-D-mannosaminyltransferase